MLNSYLRRELSNRSWEPTPPCAPFLDLLAGHLGCHFGGEYDPKYQETESRTIRSRTTTRIHVGTSISKILLHDQLSIRYELYFYASWLTLLTTKDEPSTFVRHTSVGRTWSKFQSTRRQLPPNHHLWRAIRLGRQRLISERF
ncbi:uncharacterized protein PV07_08109 [Cladophialophora immunda]|uniref:Uncharacterized protein n=1 Tax=Cladophialophora immunda TaxID=569365 RepID=A0A0D2CBK3_9EURO|nr:uncharacterized protein PV07_08109 [Cladophialophora immunda]KIW28443.1 hypothetical protein PV07_08109 [Cladophialophora immunda]